MPTPSTPLDDASRLDELWALQLLANTSEPEFENLTQLASEICDAPLAFISFMDQDRVWFKSRVGFDALHVPREHTFCTQAVQGTGPLVVEDATADPRFQDNVYVQAPNGIRFYAGIPLVLSSGHAVGTLALVDHKARTLSDKQLGSLKKLALQVTALIEAKRTTLRLEEEDRNRLLIEQRLDFAMQASGIGDWDMDLRTNVARRSLEHDQCFGYTESVAQWGYDTFLAHVVEADRARVDGCFQRAMAGLGAYDVEFHVLWPDQTLHWLWSKGRFYFDESGKPNRVAGIVIDVTERKKAEDALQASNAQLQLLETCVSRLNDIVLITEAEPFDEPGPRILFVNDAFVRRTGYSREEVIGKTPRILQGPKTQRSELDRMGAALRRWEPVRAELINYTKSGQEFWLELDIVPVANAQGWYTHWIAVERDITDRKQAEEALKDSEVRYKALVENAPMCIHELDLDGNLTSMNSSGLSMMGLNDQCQIQGLSYLAAVAEVDRSRIADLLAKAYSGASSAFEFRSAGEREQFFQSCFVPITDDIGVVLKLMGITEDITVRRQNQMELQSSVKEKTALLMEVHHRVKNNLQVISSLLRLESHRSTFDDTKAVLGDMQSRIRAMALLHESLYRRGTFASVDLGSYLRQLATQAFQAQSTNSVPVKLELNLGSVQVGMDQAVSCGLLVNELISNCLKHGFPEGFAGTVSIDLQPLETAQQWCLRVSDTGVGLPENFEEKRKNSLGLQLVGDLARQIRGELNITPNQDKGVSFTVNFQALEPAALLMPA